VRAPSISLARGDEIGTVADVLKRPIPVAFVVGLVVGLLGVSLRCLGTPASDELADFFRWHLVRGALSMTEDTLFTVGLFVLARRLTGRARAALRLASWLSLAMLAWYAALPLLETVLEREPWANTFHRWSSGVANLVTLALAIAVVIAARGAQRARVATALLLVSVLARGVVPPIVDAIQGYFRNHPDLGMAFWSATSVMWACGLFWLVATIAGDAAAPVPEPRRAARGFRFAAAALRFRLIVAVVVAVMSVGLVRTPSLVELVVIGGPAVAIGTMVAYALGFLGAAHAVVDGLSPYRLALGAAATLWFAAIQLTQLAWTYEAMHQEYSYFREHAELLASLGLAGPLIATAGLGLVGSAISAFAAARGDDDLREAAMVRTLLTVVLFGSSVGIQSQLWKASTPDGRVMLVVVAAGAGIGAIVAMIGLLRAAADALEAGPTLPAARVVGAA